MRSETTHNSDATIVRPPNVPAHGAAPSVLPLGAATTCMLLVDDRVVLRANAPPEAEYALFETGDLELRAGEPGRVREHSYRTTAGHARRRLAQAGITPELARACAEVMHPVLSEAYARGVAARRVAHCLGPLELFQSETYDGASQAYRGVFLDLPELVSDLGLPTAGIALQALYLAMVLESEAEGAKVVLSTDGWTKQMKPGQRTFRRPELSVAPDLAWALTELADRAPRPVIREQLPRADVIAFIRARADSAIDEEGRAEYISLERSISEREMPETGALADPELWAIELRLDAGGDGEIVRAIDEAEQTRGRTPATTYLRARASLTMRLEPAKLVAERVSALALSMTSFAELALLAAEAWLEAGDPRRAMPYARDLVDTAGLDEGLLLRAQRFLARAVGAAPDKRKTFRDNDATAPLPASVGPARASAAPPRVPPSTRASVAPPATLPPVTRPSGESPEPFATSATVPVVPIPVVPVAPAPAAAPPPPSLTPPDLGFGHFREKNEAPAQGRRPATNPGLGVPAPYSDPPAPSPTAPPVLVPPPPLDFSLPSPEEALPFTLDLPRSEKPLPSPAANGSVSAAAPAQSASPSAPREPRPAFAEEPPPVQNRASSAAPSKTVAPSSPSRKPARRITEITEIRESRIPAAFDPRAEPESGPMPAHPAVPTFPSSRPSGANVSSTRPAAYSHFSSRPGSLPEAARDNAPTPLLDADLPPMANDAIDRSRARTSMSVPSASPRSDLAGASLPPFKHEVGAPLLARAPLLPKFDEPADELVEHLSLPAGLAIETPHPDVLPKSVLEARVQFTYLARELGAEYRIKRRIELRADVSGIEALQAGLLETFPDHVVRTSADAFELRRYGALLSEILVRRLDAEWVDISPSELGYWSMVVPTNTRIWPFGRVARFVQMGHRERDLVSYFFELMSRVRSR